MWCGALRLCDHSYRQASAFAPGFTVAVETQVNLLTGAEATMEHPERRDTRSALAPRAWGISFLAFVALVAATVVADATPPCGT
jgi:hypothetical protein